VHRARHGRRRRRGLRLDSRQQRRVRRRLLARAGTKFRAPPVIRTSPERGQPRGTATIASVTSRQEDAALSPKEPVRDITTLQSHILERKLEQPEDGSTLSWLLSALSISAKIIAAEVRRARLVDVLGEVGSDNVQGEAQQKLDVIANETLLRTLGRREGVAVVASEENEEPVLIRDERRGPRRY